MSLQLQSISLSRGLIDPGGETTIYRMVRQVFAGAFPCQMNGDLLLTTLWVGEPGRYAVRSELVHEDAPDALAESSHEFELTGATYVLTFDYGRPVWPAPGVYRWQVYVDDRPEPIVGCFPLPVIAAPPEP